MTTAESALARTRRSLARIDAGDRRLRACVVVRPEAALEAARVDRSPRPGPLDGWTLGIKDNIDVAGTIRSDGLGPPHPAAATTDSTAVSRLRAAGAVVVAKTNLEQLSFGATTQNPTWGSCRNPWDPDRIPGGSSGGSAVAVAAGLVDAALGTDTGGSLRNPASFCGVSTLRPTHGLVPTAGVTPLSPSLDVVGPMARRVADLRVLLDVMTDAPPGGAVIPLDGLSIGVPSGYFLDDLDADVARGFDELLDVLHALGARLSSVDLPGVHDIAEATAVVLNAEAARSLREYWDDPRLDAGIAERLNLGRAVTPAELDRAARGVGAWRRTVAGKLAGGMVIATPATPLVAPKIADDNLVALSRRVNRLTGCWSPTGVPALGIPLRPSRDGMPVGGQLIGARGADRRLLAVGEAVQAASGWHELVPRPLPVSP